MYHLPISVEVPPGIPATNPSSKKVARYHLPNTMLVHGPLPEAHILDINCAVSVQGSAAAPSISPEAAAQQQREKCLQAALVDASPIQARLAQELYDKGFTDFRSVRIPTNSPTQHH